jgi:hypothetical protein
MQVDIRNNIVQGTALFYCMYNHHINAAQKLLKHGADPSIRGVMVNGDEYRFVDAITLLTWTHISLAVSVLRFVHYLPSSWMHLPKVRILFAI